MILKKISLKNFGPFKEYEISFDYDEEICLLLTGKNNEGKSTLINAIKILSNSLKVLRRERQRIKIDGVNYYRLLKQDTENYIIGRLIYNYQDTIAEIYALFDGGFEIYVYVDPINDMIYTNSPNYPSFDTDIVFGFVPPLGPLAESEDYIYDRKHLESSIGTSLAPRHLRNHFLQILSSDDFNLVKKIVKTSWKEIELLDYEFKYREGKIDCFFKENGLTREISWAGQGLQIWFQIITHLVRLRNTNILILDEPEINLHPEMQNELVKILREYYRGTIIIATHSIELMNNVNISHIINIRKNESKPRIKSSSDRQYLELIRSQVGSNFNFIASQFEHVDIIIFTEDVFDFEIVDTIREKMGLDKKTFNIPLHGFNEWRKSLYYKDAYNLLIGRNIEFTILLDKDYYPTEYLHSIKEKLETHGIKTMFTQGKEIENMFLIPGILESFLDRKFISEFSKFIDKLFSTEYLEAFASFIGLHSKFNNSKLDPKTVVKNNEPKFKETWSDRSERYKIISGKNALHRIREHFHDMYHINLTTELLVNGILSLRIKDIEDFIKEIYQS